MTGLMHRLAGAATVILLALGTGCASGTGGTPGDATLTNETTITVENFHSAAEDVNVFIVPDGGVARTALGPVPRGETRSFTFEGSRGAYRLVSVRAVGETTSERININHRTDITWNLQRNRATVSRR